MPTPTHRLVQMLSTASPREGLTGMVGELLSFTPGTTSVATTATVDFEGQGFATTCLSLDSYTNSSPAPAAGDIILALANGQDTYIIGRIS